MKKTILLLNSFILFPVVLVSCATTKIATKTEYIYEMPSESLMQPCAFPEIKFETNEDLIIALMDSMSAYSECSTRHNSLISYIKKTYNRIYNID